ncbi:hypothetical protein M0R45_020046 [Rubus argutus]|uniref:Thioredoxin domain-containing protein n=1 Tax=Rubus argutus TaxID=59490 RepID=A0AAW1X8L2_RUBAR
MARNPRVLVQQPFSSSVYAPHVHYQRLSSSVPIDSLIRLRAFTASYRNEYESTMETIRDECCMQSAASMRTNLVSYNCFHGFSNQVMISNKLLLFNLLCSFSSCAVHLPLIVQGFVENFPHVKIYHFLVFNLRKDDTYDAAMRMLNVSSMPLFLFFQNGKKVDKLVGDSIALLDKTIKNLYNPETSRRRHLFSSTTSHHADTTDQKLLLTVAITKQTQTEIDTRVSGDDGIDDGAREDRIRAWICDSTDECGEVSWGIGSGYVLHGGEKLGSGLGEQWRGVRVSEQRQAWARVWVSCGVNRASGS